MVGDISGPVGDSIAYFLELSVWMVPLFLVASFLVGLTEASLSPERLHRLMQGQRGWSGTVVGGALGAVTPFCSCASIPVLAGLLQAGAPLGIAMSFLLASPLINEVAILLLGSLFGWHVAAVYVGVTFVTVVAFGLAIDRLDLDDHVKIDPAVHDPVPDGGVRTAGGACEGTAGATGPVRTAGLNALEFLAEMAPYLLVGMGLGAVLHGFVPVAWLQALLGPENPIAVPVATIAGAPIYVSFSAMLPVASSLADHGIPLGTVVALIIGGAGVSVPTLVILARFFDRYLLSIYALIVIAVGVFVGVTVNLVPI